MSLSRRVMNLILDTPFPGAKSLRSVNLRKLLFDGTTSSTIVDGSELVHTGARMVAALNMERIELPRPIFTFESSALNHPCKTHCFPLADGKMFWADQLGSTFIFDAEERLLEFAPSLHKPKRKAFSLFVPNAEDDDGFGSSLFVMEKIPEPNHQFEALVYRKAENTCLSWDEWACQLVPPLPFAYQHISSYGVVGSGICISVDGVGSYYLNTKNYTWSEIGKWTLPFHGKFDYVPELKLWFGLAGEDRRQLAAADLSAMDSQQQPQLVTTCKKLGVVPDEWKEHKDSQLVNLGSGRFCIVSFFHTSNTLALSRDLGDDSSGHYFTIFTGMEVLPSVHDGDCNFSTGGQDLELHVIPHKSIFHMSNGTAINAVF